MNDKRITWLGHTQHFIGGQHCLFSMATAVGGVVVSTVGEYYPGGKVYGNKPTDVGFDRLYETYVFRTEGMHDVGCCPVISDYSEIDSAGYQDAKSAQEGHMAMVAKYAGLDS